MFGSLTRVRPLVSLEMRALGVHLLASGERAFVYPALRVGRTVLVAPRVVPVGHGGRRGRSCARVRVLRAGDRGEAIRRDGDQSANRIAALFIRVALRSVGRASLRASRAKSASRVSTSSETRVRGQRRRNDSRERIERDLGDGSMMDRAGDESSCASYERKNNASQVVDAAASRQYRLS